MPFRRSLSAFAAALLAAACNQNPAASQPADSHSSGAPQLGLMGTIPLYWGEAAGPADMLSGNGGAHWARAQLERRFTLHPLDVLDEASLAGLDRLLLAQPRALSPAENVALDAWVRAGGRLLLFADPMLTGHSHFAIGDRRRPQDVVLLSPILAHWGLTLLFDDEQPAGMTLRDVAGIPVPLNLPGRFEGDGACDLAADGVWARCRLGAGEVSAVADAALLDLHEPAAQAPAALDHLLEQVFGPLPAIGPENPP